MSPPLLPILYQDDTLVAICKPAGMLVHRSWLDRHETRFAMQTLRDQIGQHQGASARMATAIAANITAATPA